MPVNSNCPTPQKRSWNSKSQADQALGSIWRKSFKNGPGPLPSRPYKCKCGLWHLTSKPNQGG